MPMPGRGQCCTIAEREHNRKTVVRSRQPSGAVMAWLGTSHAIQEFEKGKQQHECTVTEVKSVSC